MMALRRAYALGLKGLLRTNSLADIAITPPQALHSYKFATQLAQALTSGSAEISYGLAASAAAVDLYTVKVATGRRRGAGTNDLVSIQLIGQNASTSKIPLPSSDGFDRGTTKEFTVPVPKGLGAVVRGGRSMRMAWVCMGFASDSGLTLSMPCRGGFT